MVPPLFSFAFPFATSLVLFFGGALSRDLSVTFVTELLFDDFATPVLSDEIVPDFPRSRLTLAFCTESRCRLSMLLSIHFIIVGSAFTSAQRPVLISSHCFLSLRTGPFILSSSSVLSLSSPELVATEENVLSRPNSPPFFPENFPGVPLSPFLVETTRAPPVFFGADDAAPP